MTRHIVLGLDGFSEMLLQRPETENIRQLFDQQGAKLDSTMPPITGPAFGTFQTGKSPGRHGIGSLIKIKGSESGFDIGEFTGSDLKSETFYEALDNAGYKCFLMNLPYTYPPRISGDLITSWLTRSEEIEDFVYPTSLLSKFPELKDYSPFPKKGTTNEFLDSCIEIEQSRISVLKQAILDDEYDLVFGLLSSTDWIQHRVYEKLLNNDSSRATELASKLLTIIDEFIGWVMSTLNPDEESFVLFSDHGFKLYDGYLSINTLLQEGGFLRYSADGTHFMNNRTEGEATSTFNVGGLYNFVRSNPFLRKIVTPIYEKLLQLGWEVVGERGIDLDSSVAYCRHDEEFSVFVDDEELRSVYKYLSGQDDLEVYNTRDLHGSAKNMGDLLVFSEKYRVIRGDGADIRENSKNPYHDKSGVVATFGKDYTGRPSSGGLVDLMPTILHCFDVAIPNDLDGSVQAHWLDEHHQNREVNLRKSRSPNISSDDSVNDTAVQERLEDLGYL